MMVELSDAAIEGTGITPDLVRLEVAVGLYRARKVSMGKAARIAGLSRPLFLHELGQRGVTVNYDIQDFEDDLAAIQKLAPR